MEKYITSDDIKFIINIIIFTLILFYIAYILFSLGLNNCFKVSNSSLNNVTSFDIMNCYPDTIPYYLN